MSSFWSGWIMFFVVLNWIIVVVLFVVANRTTIPTAKDGTTGHVWSDGEIRESARMLPGWWVVLSLLTILFTLPYLYRYPGFGDHPGSLDWTSAGQLKEQQAKNELISSNFASRVKSQSPSQLAREADIQQVGAVLFADNCAACHGPAAQGNALLGAPRLSDNIWLYGDGEQIELSIMNGRNGLMPPFGQLGSDEVHALAAHVYSLNGRQPTDKTEASKGAALFKTNCTVCHGPDAKGNPMLGAPNLTDQDWLYGGSVDNILHSIEHGRQGHMPAWKGRLSAVDIKILQSWILALGQAPSSDSGERTGA